MLTNIKLHKIRRYDRLMKEFNKLSNLIDLPTNDDLRNSKLNQLKSRNLSVELLQTLQMDHFNPKTIQAKRKEQLSSSVMAPSNSFNLDKNNLCLPKRTWETLNRV